MSMRSVLLVCALLASMVGLVAMHQLGDPGWVREVPATPGADGVLWQVQTTFLSVGFAGLAIAAQLFAEAPLAIGASRERVLEHIWAGWFVGVGLVANIIIAVETIWLPSDLAILTVVSAGFASTVVLLVFSYVRLVRLFGRPSLLDEVVRVSLVEAQARRLDRVSSKYGEARRQLKGIFAPEFTGGVLGSSPFTVRVSVPQVGLVVRAIKPQVVRRAMASLEPRVTAEGSTGGNGTDDLYNPAQITLDLEPGERTGFGDTVFRVRTSQELDRRVQDELVRLLQTSIEFEPSAFVTPDEETDRDITNLQDAIGTSLRSGAYGTAERALDLLGHVVRGVWMARPESLDAPRRSSFTRDDWLLHSIGEVEQDVLLSPRAAGLFIKKAMTRSIEASRAASTPYVDECLRSFTRIWHGILRHGGSEFEVLVPRITTCVQNLAVYSYSTADRREDLQARATWAMVELVKLALDAKKPEAARLAAQELNGLFEYVGRRGSGRTHVRAGQLVLSGWLDYLTDKGDDRSAADASLRALVVPGGNWSEIISARSLAERRSAPFTRWDWWEIDISGPGGAQMMELPGYIDRAMLVALARSYGTLPPAVDQETASEYERFLRLLEESDRELSQQENVLKQRLSEVVNKWEVAEKERLANEPLSQRKVVDLHDALRETLADEERLAAEIPMAAEIPETADVSRPILGMNFRVPRHYLVSKIFNQTHADPKEIGRMIARAFAEGEEQRIVDELRSLESELFAPTARAIRQQIDALGDDATHYVLITPYGRLGDDIQEWYSAEFRDTLARVKHIESSLLDAEAIMFDRRTTIVSYRQSEEKDGLKPVAGTTIALGVFEDAQSADEPQVRIETGERFVVWQGEAPNIVRFALPPLDHGSTPDVASSSKPPHGDPESTSG